jgi:hypothetical protein
VVRRTILLTLLVSSFAVEAEAQVPLCVEVAGHNDRCPAWAVEYPPAEAPADHCTEEVAHQIVAPSGVYMAATRICGGAFDILTLAYDFDGRLRWVRTHDGPAHRRDHAFNLAASPDGQHLYVAGSEDSGQSYDWVTISYDTSNGEQEWVARHDGPAHGDDEAWLAALSDDGERLYVAGFDIREREDGEETAETVTIAYDALTGQKDWSVRFDGDARVIDYPRAIGVSGHRVVVTGSSLDFFTQDLQTVAYRDDREAHRAEELWRASYDGGDWDQPLSPCLTRGAQICLGLMGSVAVTEEIVAVAATSFVDPATDDSVWTTIAYDLDSGERLWLKKFGDPSLQNKANAVAASPDGDTVYVTGFTNDELLFDGVGDAAAVAYDAGTGEERWRSNLALPGVEDASGFGLAATPQAVYLGGQIDVWASEGVRKEVLTIAHDALTGDHEWVARHSRTTPVGLGKGDGGNWAAIGPDGSKLFVGGGFANTFRVEDQQDFWDLGLLAYDL